MENTTQPDQDVIGRLQREHLSRDLRNHAPALSMPDHDLVIDWALGLLEAQKTAMIEVVERELVTVGS